MNKLEKQPGLMIKYNGIIQDQIDQGIVEKVKSPTYSANKEFFIPHKLVVHKTAESSYHV